MAQTFQDKDVGLLSCLLRNIEMSVMINDNA